MLTGRSGGLPVILGLLCSLASCSAPHHNPLDPDNPDTIVRSIKGTVRTDSRTPAPLAQVTVLWQNEGISGVSDAAGTFSLTTIGTTDGWLRFEKPGFRTDSVMVRWGGKKSVSVDGYLDADPVLDSLMIYTVVKNWYSQREYSLAVDASVADDDDVDTVWISNAELALRKPLTKISSVLFQGRFYDYDLPVTSLEELVGRPLNQDTRCYPEPVCT